MFQFKDFHLPKKSSASCCCNILSAFTRNLQRKKTQQLPAIVLKNRKIRIFFFLYNYGRRTAQGQPVNITPNIKTKQTGINSLQRLRTSTRVYRGTRYRRRDV